MQIDYGNSPQRQVLRGRASSCIRIRPNVENSQIPPKRNKHRLRSDPVVTAKIENSFKLSPDSRTNTPPHPPSNSRNRPSPSSWPSPPPPFRTAPPNPRPCRLPLAACPGLHFCFSAFCFSSKHLRQRPGQRRQFAPARFVISGAGWKGCVPALM